MLTGWPRTRRDYPVQAAGRPVAESRATECGRCVGEVCSCPVSIVSAL
jgi:hypothetical protein